MAYDQMQLTRNIIHSAVMCQSFGNAPTLTTIKQFNSLWLSDAIWRWRSWSTVVNALACCLTAPSHYLNQC